MSLFLNIYLSLKDIQITMVCVERYAVAIIKNKTGEPLTESDIKFVMTTYKNYSQLDILLDTIDATETKYGTLITAEVDNRDGSMKHSKTPIKSVVVTLYPESNAAMMY